MKRHTHRTSEGGFALILNAAMLVFTVAVIGLAVDAGIAFLVKAKLSAAVDAAALAAGRSVNLANTVSQATTQATTMATNFFNSNFPSGYFGSNTPTLTPTFTQEKDGSGNINGLLDIKVTATVQIPTYFMRIFNINTVGVSATGTASRRGLVLILVLDNSASMGSGAGSSLEAMKAAAQNFITYFSPYDYIGMVRFDQTANLDYAPSQTYGDGSLNTTIGNIPPGGNTNTTSALELAYQQIKSQNLPLAENVIVLFTDGSPNGVSCDFPLRTSQDDRWGPALSGSNPPPAGTPSGTLWGKTYNCADGVNADATYYNDHDNAPCRAPVICTAAGTIRGTITQVTDQNPYGGDTNGVFPPMYSDPAVTYPSSCTSHGTPSGAFARQMIAYIPDTDIYGNSTHGVVSPGTGPTVVGGVLTRDGWLYQVSQQCSPDPTVSPNCKYMGDFWSNHTLIGSGNNKFLAGPYTGNLRPDQPNSIVAASMNTAMAEAYRIRSDSTYHIVINSIYLTGNGKDAIDREFLPVISNVQTIPALPYDPLTYSPYSNPAFQTNQEHGKYLVTADKTRLNGLFAQLASEVLRLSK